MKNPARKKTRSSAQRAATAKLVAMNKARRKSNPSTGKRIQTTVRARADYIESAKRGRAAQAATALRVKNPTAKIVRGLGYAVVASGHPTSIWRDRGEAIKAGRDLANQTAAPVRVVAGAWTFTAD